MEVGVKCFILFILQINKIVNREQVCLSVLKCPLIKKHINFCDGIFKGLLVWAWQPKSENLQNLRRWGLNYEVRGFRGD